MVLGAQGRVQGNRAPVRAANLASIIKKKKATLVRASRLQIIDPVEGDCETEIRRLISECERDRVKLGPAFFFLGNL